MSGKYNTDVTDVTLMYIDVPNVKLKLHIYIFTWHLDKLKLISMSGKCNLRKNQYTCTCVYMCEQIQPRYNQGKLKLTRYIYWTSPLAKAKGNVWQGQPNNVTDVTLMWDTT